MGCLVCSLLGAVFACGPIWEESGPIRLNASVNQKREDCLDPLASFWLAGRTAPPGPAISARATGRRRIRLQVGQYHALQNFPDFRLHS
ncbi:hypothetical protein B0T16DRAFT_236553 [Cercophora newfieldiana]|uniref:Uncharacterized protein n=1 Tax=Cercophora newfieldiana TaxID=92897 RepID=A0AA39XRV1_9PEZI|nr:hypothetical protein B0T16DRAFT_236553 [Cercophora newfieldiana]